MTAYHGGKQRIGKQLAEAIVAESLHIAEERGFEIQGYAEPFCGMLGVYRHVPGLFEEAGLDELDYLAGDANKSVVLMWKAAQQGWKPPITCSEEDYNELKNAEDSPARGFIGHQCSFRGKYFAGYARRYDGTKRGPERASKRVIEIATALKSVDITHGLYDRYSELKGYVIYCDPPYSQYNRYYVDKHRLKFDHKDFWDWCRQMSRNNIVMVTEYHAPSGVRSIREFSHTTSYRGHVTNNTEILYVVE